MNKESFIPLHTLAYARSGDKGSSSNIGVIAKDQKAFELLIQFLTEEVVQEYFLPLGVKTTKRYELPNLLALNFVLEDVLAGGGSRSLRTDSQGKALGQALLQLEIRVKEEI